MKKSLFGLLMLALVSLSMASAWTAPTTYPVLVATIDSVKVDSITGIDSVVMALNKTIDPTATYALRTMDSIAAGDSVYLLLRLYDGKGKLVNALVADTLIQSTSYKVSALPINKTASGSTFTLKAKGAVAVLKRIFKSYNILKIVPITPYKPEYLK